MGVTKTNSDIQSKSVWLSHNIYITNKIPIQGSTRLKIKRGKPKQSDYIHPPTKVYTPNL